MVLKMVLKFYPIRATVKVCMEVSRSIPLLGESITFSRLSMNSSERSA
jgi:hypothetical protein